MYIHIRVTPKAKRECIIETKKDHYAVSVREPAERNMANSRVIEMVRELWPEARMVRIVSGHTSPSKIVSVDEGGV
jgi:uncharacterized protein (TIGR00251 family)